MDKYEIGWVIFGTILLAFVSSLIYSGHAMSPVAPVPTHMILLAWTTEGPLFVAVMPLIYLVEFTLIGRKPYLGRIVLAATAGLALLSLIWFFAFWEYGIRYQGERHTTIVAIENAVGFTTLLALAMYALRKRSARLQRTANLFMFTLLTWCAFPYLGELP